MRVIRIVLIKNKNNGPNGWSRLVLVPLDDTPDNDMKPYIDPTKGPKYCIVDERDFRTLMDLNIRQRWSLRSKGHLVRKPQVFLGKDSKMSEICRLIMDAGEGQSVMSINGNHLDCRRSNLAVGYSPIATRRDRDLIKSSPLDAKVRAVFHDETDREFNL
jgi:hypothetical protein